MINLSTLQEKYNTRTEREKKILMLAGVVILLVLVLNFLKALPQLLQPTYQRQLETQQKAFVKILPKIAEVKQLKQIVQSYAKGDQIDLYAHLNKNKPTLNVLDNEQPVIIKKDKAVEIKYQAVGYDDLMLWLERLQKQQGIGVVSADIAAVPEETGYVTATIVLQ